MVVFHGLYVEDQLPASPNCFVSFGLVLMSRLYPKPESDADKSWDAQTAFLSRVALLPGYEFLDGIVGFAAARRIAISFSAAASLCCASAINARRSMLTKA